MHAESSASTTSSEAQRLDTPSTPSVDADLGSNLSGSSWRDPDGSNQPLTTKASDTSYPAQASDASSVHIFSAFPENPTVFLRESNGKTEIIGSWGGIFVASRVDNGPFTGKPAFEYQPRGHEIPNTLRSIKFQPPSPYRLEQFPGQKDYWLIGTPVPVGPVGMAVGKRQEDSSRRRPP